MNPIRTPVEKCMLRNVLRLARNTPVDLAIEIIEERRPDAVLLLNNDKSFFGLLSPSDYEVLKKYGTPNSNMTIQSTTCNCSSGENCLDEKKSLLSGNTEVQTFFCEHRNFLSNKRITTCLFSFLSNAIKQVSKS